MPSQIAKKNILYRCLSVHCRWQCFEYITFAACHKFLFWHFLPPSASGRIQTLDLRITGRVLNHCATSADLEAVTFFIKKTLQFYQHHKYFFEKSFPGLRNCPELTWRFSLA
jgi:hypothetical protein